METPRWYAIVVSGRAAGFMDNRRRFPEFAAVEGMREQGAQAFAPVLRILRRPHRYARRREIAVAPLLPGYCFLFAPRPPTSDEIRRWPYVLGIVRRGFEPAVLPPDQVEALMALDGTQQPLVGALPYDASGKVTSGDGFAQRVLKAGDRAIVVKSGIEGQVEQVHREKATLLVEFLGSVRRTSVAVRDLEHAAPARVFWN